MCFFPGSAFWYTDFVVTNSGSKRLHLQWDRKLNDWKLYSAWPVTVIYWQTGMHSVTLQAVCLSCVAGPYSTVSLHVSINLSFFPVLIHQIPSCPCLAALDCSVTAMPWCPIFFSAGRCVLYADKLRNLGCFPSRIGYTDAMLQLIIIFINGLIQTF